MVAAQKIPITGQNEVAATNGRNAIMVEENGVSSAEHRPTCCATLVLLSGSTQRNRAQPVAETPVQEPKRFIANSNQSRFTQRRHKIMQNTLTRIVIMMDIIRIGTQFAAINLRFRVAVAAQIQISSARPEMELMVALVRITISFSRDH